MRSGYAKQMSSEVSVWHTYIYLLISLSIDSLVQHSAVALTSKEVKIENYRILHLNTESNHGAESETMRPQRKTRQSGVENREVNTYVMPRQQILANLLSIWVWSRVPFR